MYLEEQYPVTLISEETGVGILTGQSPGWLEMFCALFKAGQNQCIITLYDGRIGHWPDQWRGAADSFVLRQSDKYERFRSIYTLL